MNKVYNILVLFAALLLLASCNDFEQEQENKLFSGYNMPTIGTKLAGQLPLVVSNDQNLLHHIH